MRFDEAIYAHFLKQRRARFLQNPTRFDNCKIVSVGNITTGGTGKTPAVQWLARRLAQNENRVAIVSRGYGGTLSKAGAIVSDGQRVHVSEREAGDEPLLHARALENVPVVIGRDRVRAVETVIEKFAPDVIILDDAFQYWSLARDFDLVLLDARQPFGNGHLLPRGRLREEPEMLRRAHAIMLTRSDAANENEMRAARKQIARFTDAPIYTSQHAPTILRDETAHRVLDVAELRNAKIAALSAIADNVGFARSLGNLGAQIVATCARRDHYAWTEKDVRIFAKNAVGKGAMCVVTTAKDAVKIPENWCAPLPLWVLDIELRIDNEETLLNQILTAIS